MTALVVAMVIAGASPAPVEYPGCNTHACVRRVQAKAHARTLERWRRVARPYRAWLARVRACETRGQRWPYRTNTGNGYTGAYQFDDATWRSVGGKGRAYEATPVEQDYRAVRLLHLQGRGAWPVCG